MNWLSNNINSQDEIADIDFDASKASLKLFHHSRLEFCNLSSRKMKEISSFNGLKPEGMFKIEGRNPLYGERVLWENRFYRFKHVISGKYLSIGSDDKLYLVRDMDNTSLFSLHPIKFLKSDKIKRYVKKDSYFMLLWQIILLE